MKASGIDKAFDVIVVIFLAIFLFIVAYPLYFVTIASVSAPTAVIGGKVVFWPVGFSMAGYKRVIEYNEVWIGYRNTIFYVLGYTLLSVSLTLMGGYALSRKSMPGQRYMLLYIAFTMYFNGGMIPTYLVVSSLGLKDNPLVIIIVGCVSAYNIIVTRTFIKSNISEEMFEAASLDGCSHFQFFFRIVLPLSPAIIAVMVLFNAVGQWNSWFNAMIYLRDSNMMPLQYKLRTLLLSTAQAMMDSGDSSASMMGDDGTANLQMIEAMKYAVIIVSTLPIMCIYPFLQRYFVKGIMVGAIKG
jgi:putative aldouronate transport system permease protein